VGYSYAAYRQIIHARALPPTVSSLPMTRPPTGCCLSSCWPCRASNCVRPATARRQ
jgi:hypothetical protein